MLSSLSTHLCVWFYVLCGMFVMQTQINIADAACKDVWSNCNAYMPYCQDTTQMKTVCQKTCGFCGASRSGKSVESVQNFAPKARSVRSKPAIIHHAAPKQSTGSVVYKGNGKAYKSVPKDIPASSRVVKLNKNKIEGISSSDFSHLPRVGSLQLGQNKISYIPDGTFSNVKNLMVLSLTGNAITEMHDNAFRNLNRLITLILSYNRLTSINDKIFSKLPELQRLYFKYNKIRSSKLNDNAFRNLKNLITLDFSFNQLDEIKPPTFSGLSLLSTLNLKWNFIRIVRSGSFSQLDKLKLLNLEHNKIDTLGNDVFSSGKFGGSSSVKLELKLANNPWICDDKIKWIIDAKTKNRLKNTDFKCKSVDTGL